MKENSEIMKESYRENIELNLKSFDHFLPKDSLVSTKRLDQLYALTRNLRKNLEKKQFNDSSLNVFLEKENINLQKMDKDILEIQNVIQTKYDLPTQQTGIAPSDKFYHYDNFEQSLEQKLNSINSNLSLFPLNLGNNSCNSLLLSTVDKKPISCRFVKNSNMTNTVKRPETNSVFKAFNTIINQNSLNNSANSELYGQSLSKTNSIGGLGLNNNQNVLMNNYNQNDIFMQTNNYFNADIYTTDNDLFRKYYNSLYSFFSNKANNKERINDVRDDRIQMQIAVQSLSSSFISNQKSIYDLLFYQLSLNSHNNNSKNVLSTSSLINSSICYYEKDFYDRLCRNNINKTTNNNYNTKLKLIEEYTYQKLYSKYSNEINGNNKDEIIIWAKIFYFLRCGFINECSKFIEDSNLSYPELSFFSTVLTSNKIKREDYQTLKKFLNPNDKEYNSFKHACLVYITKNHQPLNDYLLDDFNDYMWFHLNLINYNDDKYRDLTANNAEVVTLEKFQKYILSISPSDLIIESSNIVIDYTKCLMSILLFDKALEYLSKSKGYGVDTANLYLILYRCGLSCNFSTVNTNEIIFDPSMNKNMNISKYSFVIQNYASNHLYEVLLYIRFGDVKYRESIAELIRQQNAYYILYENIISFTNNSFQREENIIPLMQIFSNEDIYEILRNIAVKFPMNPVMNDRVSFNQLLILLKRFRLYTELLNLLFLDIYQILRNKTPEEVYNPMIHGKRVQGIYEEHIITSTYKTTFDEINSSLSEENDNHDFYMFKFMRQLESVEEVYDLITVNRKAEAYDKFMRMVTMAQVDNIEEFINYSYKEMNGTLQDIFVDVCYLYFFLMKNRLSYLKNNLKGGFNRERNEDEMNYIKKNINNLLDLIEKLSMMKMNLKYHEKYELIMNEINGFTTMI